MHSKPNHVDERSTLVRTFALLGEARIALYEVVAIADEPTASISAEMAERLFQEAQRIRTLLRAEDDERRV